jgi:hypothetical protein
MVRRARDAEFYAAAVTTFRRGPTSLCSLRETTRLDHSSSSPHQPGARGSGHWQLPTASYFEKGRAQNWAQRIWRLAELSGMEIKGSRGRLQRQRTSPFF